MTEHFISKATREFLIKHLVEIEGEKSTILNEFFPKVTAESIEFEKLIGNYITTIEDFIKNAKVSQRECRSIPFILIGNTVKIRDLQDNTFEAVKIVSPFLNQGQINYTFASYLSPIGKELLLKKKGDKVSIKIPTGSFEYLIDDFGFPAGGL